MAYLSMLVLGGRNVPGRGATGNLTVRNRWPGQNVAVVNGSGATVTSTQTTATFTVSVQAGGSYLIQRTSAPTTALPYAPVSGTAATTPKTLNGRSIGLAKRIIHVTARLVRSVGDH